MAEKYTRIHRLLKILTLIQAEPGWNADRLAAECGTSTRNVYRDLNMIQGAGIPYHFDNKTDGYRVGMDFFMPPVELTLDESLALIALAENIGAKEQIPFLKAASKAIAKVKGQLPAAVRDELADLDDHIDIQLAQASSDEAQDVYEKVRSAISRRRVLRCSYESLSSRSESDRAEEVFEFRPYRLLFSQRAWYAVGLHGGRDEVRILKLSRFAKVESTDIAYAVPEDFKLEAHLGQAWRMIRGDTRYKVTLHFDAAFAENIADTIWHATQEIEWLEDESIRFHCEVDGLDEIVWWVLSMGPHCQVEQPAELIDRVRDLAAGIVAQYPAKAQPRKKASTTEG